MTCLPPCDILCMTVGKTVSHLTLLARDIDGCVLDSMFISALWEGRASPYAQMAELVLKGQELDFPVDREGVEGLRESLVRALHVSV